MQWTIQSPHIDVSAKTKNAIVRKFNRFDRFYDRIEYGTIVLKREKNNKQANCIVEAKLAIPNNDLFAREQCSSFEIAAEKVCLDLESQLKKRKGKLEQRSVELDQNVSNEESE